MSDSLSAELWRGVTGVYDAILAHPFLTGLTDGSLPHDAFAFYVVQDAIYLRSYARALAGVAGRAPAPSQAEMFARHAADATHRRCSSYLFAAHDCGDRQLCIFQLADDRSLRLGFR